MSRTDNIKEGDLVVRRGDKKPYIVLEVKRYQRTVYGAGGTSGNRRKKFLLLSPDGRQSWKIDTAMKVEFYLPGSPHFDDIR